MGHATPEGTRALVRFVIDEIVEPSGDDIGVDWHGHRDRGLGLANTLAAIQAGVTRVHGTALGIGERAGNAEMDLLLVNLKLLGLHDHDLTRLPASPYPTLPPLISYPSGRATPPPPSRPRPAPNAPRARPEAGR